MSARLFYNGANFTPLDAKPSHCVASSRQLYTYFNIGGGISSSSATYATIDELNPLVFFDGGTLCVEGCAGSRINVASCTFRSSGTLNVYVIE